MPLFEDSGQSPDRRNEEATTITRRLQAWLDEDPDNFDKLDDWQRVFVTDMTTRLKKFGRLKFINPRQLYQLREVYQKTAEL